MNINVWSGFSKRKNSTKRPSSGTNVTVELKEPTSITAPVFKLSTQGVSVNYVEVPSWNRYYFVTDAVQVTKDMVELHCKVDTLASAKSYIKATTAPVDFANSSDNQYVITDPRNHPTYIYDEKYTALLDLDSLGFSTSGRYICGIVSDEGLRYYVMTEAELASFCTAIFDTNFLQSLVNNFYDLKNILVSCIWLPYVPSTVSLAVPITVGGEVVVSSANYIPNSSRVKTFNIAETQVGYPTDNTYNTPNYLDVAPYTSGTIYLPFVGVVPFDVDIFFKDRTLGLQLRLDQFTGDMIYLIQDTAKNIVSTYQASCAVSVPIAGQTTNPAGAIPGAISAIGGAAGIVGGALTGQANLIAGGLGAIAGGALATARSMELHTQVNGSVSSAVSITMPLVACAIIRTRRPSEALIESAWKASNGWTYYKEATLSGLTGYIQCQGASVDCPFTDGEKDEINSYLNSGFFLE